MACARWGTRSERLDAIMSIHVFGEKADRTHENQMLQAFLLQLEERWADSDDWIFVIANSMWSGAEIDLVCILPSAIIVADFKSYEGVISGTENAAWTADGIIVKGGRKNNPFQQLRDNKFAVLNWLESKRMLKGRALGHISSSVIFSGSITDNLDLSPKVRSWFYPTDLGNCAKLFDNVASPDLRIEKKEVQEIIDRLGARSMSWESKRPKIHVIPSPRPQEQIVPALTSHQKEAIQSITHFLTSDESVAFSVRGMTSTGKSRLLSELTDQIHKSGRQVIVLKPNRRLAVDASNEASSIYSHLYSGGVQDEDHEKSDKDDAEPRVIPLRECKDDRNCVYLVDDAHLLGNTRFTTPDGKVYGTGKLLNDFFDFAEFEETKRKVIFFGDPYQIQRANAAESVLSGEFQKSREIGYQELELSQVIDAQEDQGKLANALLLVAALREGKFAKFSPVLSGAFRVAESKDAAREMISTYRSDPHSAWYLAETHDKANVFVRWIREQLHGRKTLDSLEPGDLLEVFSAPESGSPDTGLVSFQSGARQTVKRVRQRNEYEQGLNWAKRNPVKFHSITTTLGRANSSDVELFEEFLISEKPELDKETAVAERVWRDGINRARHKFHNDNQRELEVTSHSEPPKPAPDFVYARYGYAATVHHAQGMTKRRCYLNCDHAAGRHTDGFFRWLYSALTVAEEEVVLLNFSEIHPLDAADWNAASAMVTKEIPVGAGWTFQPDGIASETDQNRIPPVGLNQSHDILKSAAIWLNLSQSLENLGWRITKVSSHPYLERYELAGSSGQTCNVRVSYNGKNTITAMHLDDEQYWPLLADVAAGCIKTTAKSPEAETLITCITSRLEGDGWKIVSLTETAYRMAITVAREFNERVSIEVNFDKQGLASSLRPRQASHPELIETIKEALL
jgi:hypothetical protein